MLNQFLNVLSNALDGLGSRPWSVHAAVGLAMAAGLVLWLCGRRVLKPLLVMLAMLVGATAGAIVLPGVSGTLSVGQGLGIGVVVGLMSGLLLHKSAMALACGVVMGAGLPLVMAAVLERYPIGLNSQTSCETTPVIGDAPSGGVQALASSWMEDGDMQALAAKIDHRSLLAEFGRGGVDLSAEIGYTEIPKKLQPAADRMGKAWAAGTSRARESWDAMPPAHRAVVGLAGVIGLAGGIISGLLMPMWAGGAVTSLLGAAVWLPSFVWLSNALGAPWGAALNRTPGTWLMVWAAAAALGMIVQWRASRRAKRVAE